MDRIWHFEELSKLTAVSYFENAWSFWNSNNWTSTSVLNFIIYSVPANTVQAMMRLDGIDKIYTTKIYDNFPASILNVKGIAIIAVYSEQ